MDINEIGIKHQLEQEIVRYDRFQYGVLGKKKEVVHSKMDNDVDIRTYAKYILKEGSIVEKRELLGCLKSNVVLTDKQISLKNV